MEIHETTKSIFVEATRKEMAQIERILYVQSKKEVFFAEKVHEEKKKETFVEITQKEEPKRIRMNKKNAWGIKEEIVKVFKNANKKLSTKDVKYLLKGKYKPKQISAGINYLYRIKEINREENLYGRGYLFWM